MLELAHLIAGPVCGLYLADMGADVIKITSTGGVLSQQGRGLEGHFDPAEIRAITRTAHRLGLKVAAHAHGARGIEDAARAGFDSIDHGTFADAAAIQEMKAKGTWMVPTLMAFTGVRDRLGKNIYTPVVEAKGRQALAVRIAGSLGATLSFEVSDDSTLIDVIIYEQSPGLQDNFIVANPKINPKDHL